MNPIGQLLPCKMGKAIMVLVYACGLMPLGYAACAYWLLGSYNPGIAERASFLVAVPLVISGAVKWWDICVHPGPKIGANSSPVSPNDFMGSCVVHMLGMAFCIVLFFIVDSIGYANLPGQSNKLYTFVFLEYYSPIFSIFLFVFITSFSVPAKHGFDSGYPIQEG